MTEKRVLDAIASFRETNDMSWDNMGELARFISAALLTPWRRKVYDALTDKPKTVQQIALEADIAPASVAAVLAYLLKETTLVAFKQQGNGKKWFKS